MRVRSKAILACGAVILAIASSACGKVANLQARKTFKEANGLYQAQNYKEAAAKYEEVVKSDPNYADAYFFLANSYGNLYRPARQGEAENDSYLEKAIANYKLAVEKEDSNPDPELGKRMKKLALDYLVDAYGPDKLNDPTLAEPVVQQMIQMDPSDSQNYFMLAKLYEDNGAVDEAEAIFLKAKEVQPKNAQVYQQLAGFYQRQGQFDKLIEAVNQRAELEPNNPEAHYFIATQYWDEAYRNTRLSETEKQDYTQKGLEEIEKALQLNPNYVDAIVYKGLLIRVQAAMEKDAGRQKQLLNEATALQEKAADMKKRAGA